MESKKVVLSVPAVPEDPAVVVRDQRTGQKCSYSGVLYNEGAIICGGGQLLQCRDGGWDVIKPDCD